MCWQLEGGTYGSTSVVIVDAVSNGDAGVCEMDGTSAVCACESTADVDCDGSWPSAMESFTSSLGLRLSRGIPNVESQGSTSLNGVRLPLRGRRW